MNTPPVNTPFRTCCLPAPNISYHILCARVCPKPPDYPIAKWVFDKDGLNNNVLMDVSTFFDNATNSDRYVRWKIMSSNRVLYDFGWNILTSPILELSNGATHDNFILGVNNIDIINFLNSLPNTFIDNRTPIVITSKVRDSVLQESLLESNRYIFFNLY